MDQFLFARGRTVARVENESGINEATERGLISTDLGGDVLVLCCKDLLFFRGGRGDFGLSKAGVRHPSSDRYCGDCEYEAHVVVLGYSGSTTFPPPKQA